MGKASDLLLLDEEDRVLRQARTPARAAGRGERQPAEGELYEPPRPNASWIATDLDAVGEAAFMSLIAAAGQARTLEALLVERVPGLGALLARETAWRAARGEPPWEVFLELRSRLGESGRVPMLYSPVPLEQLSEAVALDARNLHASPFPLESAAALTAAPMTTVNEAEAAASACLLRHMAYLSLQRSLSGLLRNERRRAARLTEVLEAELSDAAAGGEQDRRRGELILASLNQARKEGGVVRVANHYGPPG